MSLSVKNVVAMNFMCPIIFFICNIIHHFIKMAILSLIKSHSDAVDYFKELPFYNKPIEKPKVKRFKTLIN